MYKSGFINILGKPNVGKSTLMNALIGEKLSIITSKAQTTRHRIFGILNEPDYQMVFSDTPGILDPHYKMQKNMMNFVHETFEDADIFLFLAEIKDKPENQPEEFKKILETNIYTIIALNKCDNFANMEIEQMVNYWKTAAPNAIVLPISAKEKTNLDELLDMFRAQLPEGPAYFDKDAITDRSERYFVTEIIREKILKLYKEEIPYSCEVVINSFVEGEELDKISAEIYVNRKTQKPILIGKNGEMIKQLGIESRIDIEKFLDKKVYLELHVKVLENWRDNDSILSKFGY